MKVGVYRPVLEVHCFRQEIYADGGLVRVVEAVVHEACDQRSLAHCNNKKAGLVSLSALTHWLHNTEHLVLCI